MLVKKVGSDSPYHFYMIKLTIHASLRNNVLSLPFVEIWRVAPNKGRGLSGSVW